MAPFKSTAHPGSKFNPAAADFVPGAPAIAPPSTSLEHSQAAEPSYGYVQAGLQGFMQPQVFEHFDQTHPRGPAQGEQELGKQDTKGKAAYEKRQRDHNAQRKKAYKGKKKARAQNGEGDSTSGSSNSSGKTHTTSDTDQSTRTIIRGGVPLIIAEDRTGGAESSSHAARFGGFGAVFYNQMQCSHCGLVGHLAHMCIHPEKESCWHCGEKGHISRVCPNKAPSRRYKGNTITPPPLQSVQPFGAQMDAIGNIYLQEAQNIRHINERHFAELHGAQRHGAECDGAEYDGAELHGAERHGTGRQVAQRHSSAPPEFPGQIVMPPSKFPWKTILGEPADKASSGDVYDAARQYEERIMLQAMAHRATQTNWPLMLNDIQRTSSTSTGVAEAGSTVAPSSFVVSGSTVGPSSSASQNENAITSRQRSDTIIQHIDRAVQNQQGNIVPVVDQHGHHGVFVVQGQPSAVVAQVQPGAVNAQGHPGLVWTGTPEQEALYVSNYEYARQLESHQAREQVRAKILFDFHDFAGQANLSTVAQNLQRTMENDYLRMSPERVALGYNQVALAWANRYALLSEDDLVAELQTFHPDSFIQGMQERIEKLSKRTKQS